MALTQANFKIIIARISEENGLKESVIYSQISDIYQLSASWGSASAKQLAFEKNISPSDVQATGKGGKITLNDVRRVANIKIESKESIYPFVSKKAKELATEHKLDKTTKKSFPMNARSGIDKKTGRKTKITLADVRRVSNVSVQGKVVEFASKSAQELADKHKISPDEIKNRSGKLNKIKLSDIQEYISKKGNETDEENSDVDEEEDSESDIDEEDSESDKE